MTGFPAEGYLAALPAAAHWVPKTPAHCGHQRRPGYASAPLRNCRTSCLSIHLSSYPPTGDSPCQERRLQRRLPSGRRAVECPRCRSRRGPAPALAPRGSSRCISGEEGSRGPMQRTLKCAVPVRSPALLGGGASKPHSGFVQMDSQVSEMGKLRPKAAHLTVQSQGKVEVWF